MLFRSPLPPIPTTHTLVTYSKHFETFFPLCVCVGSSGCVCVGSSGCACAVCVYVNKHGSCGPHLDRKQMQRLPDHFGPGPVNEVLQQAVQTCLDCAYQPKVLLGALQTHAGGGEVVRGTGHHTGSQHNYPSPQHASPHHNMPRLTTTYLTTLQHTSPQHTSPHHNIQCPPKVLEQ